MLDKFITKVIKKDVLKIYNILNYFTFDYLFCLFLFCCKEKKNIMNYILSPDKEILPCDGILTNDSLTNESVFCKESLC